MIRIIQAGMGGWGRDWVKTVLTRSDTAALVACVDADPASLALARKEIDLPARSYFSSLGAALEAVDAEAVLITANLPAHVRLATEALRAGKHVLLEKPFAPSIAEARQVVDLAAERNRVLMISQNYRFYPAVRAARDLVRQGSMGRVGAVSVDFRRYANAAPPGGSRLYTLRQPLLAEMAVHHFDLMRAVLGQELVEVTCRAWNPPWSKFQDPATAYAIIGFDGGAVVSYRGSWVSPGPQTAWAGEWRIECDGAEIAWTSRDGKSASADRVNVKPPGKRARRAELPALPQIGRAGCLHAFADAIATGAEPESSGRDNLGTMALVYAAIESARKGAPVRIKDTGADEGR